MVASVFRRLAILACCLAISHQSQGNSCLQSPRFGCTCPNGYTKDEILLTCIAGSPCSSPTTFFIQWLYGNGSCYHIFKSSTWENSRATCLQYEADIASVETVGEENFLRGQAQLRSTSVMFVGLKYERTRQYYWLNGQNVPASSSKWVSKPSASDGECGRMNFATTPARLQMGSCKSDVEFLPCKKVARGPCANNPCQNGGLCYNNNGQALCTCAFGWRGPTCSVKVCQTVSLLQVPQQQKTFQACQQQCSSNGMHLADIKTKDDYECLMNNTAHSTPLWVGLSVSQASPQSIIFGQPSATRENFAVKTSTGPKGVAVWPTGTPYGPIYLHNKVYVLSQANYDTGAATRCVCSQGYDECLSRGCHADATCVASATGRTCQCKQGYQGDGHSCSPTECPSLSGIANGGLTQPERRLVGTIADFICHPGFVLQGAAQLLCTAQGQWDNPVPRCVPAPTTLPPPTTPPPTTTPPQTTPPPPTTQLRTTPLPKTTPAARTSRNASTSSAAATGRSPVNPVTGSGKSATSTASTKTDKITTTSNETGIAATSDEIDVLFPTDDLAQNDSQPELVEKSESSSFTSSAAGFSVVGACIALLVATGSIALIFRRRRSLKGMDLKEQQQTYADELCMHPSPEHMRHRTETQVSSLTVSMEKPRHAGRALNEPFEATDTYLPPTHQYASHAPPVSGSTDPEYDYMANVYETYVEANQVLGSSAVTSVQNNALGSSQHKAAMVAQNSSSDGSSLYDEPRLYQQCLQDRAKILPTMLSASAAFAESETNGGPQSQVEYLEARPAVLVNDNAAFVGSKMKESMMEEEDYMDADLVQQSVGNSVKAAKARESLMEPLEYLDVGDTASMVTVSKASDSASMYGQIEDFVSLRSRSLSGSLYGNEKERSLSSLTTGYDALHGASGNINGRSLSPTAAKTTNLAPDKAYSGLSLSDIGRAPPSSPTTHSTRLLSLGSVPPPNGLPPPKSSPNRSSLLSQTTFLTNAASPADTYESADLVPNKSGAASGECFYWNPSG